MGKLTERLAIPKHGEVTLAKLDSQIEKLAADDNLEYDIVTQYQEFVVIMKTRAERLPLPSLRQTSQVLQAMQTF